MENLKRLKELEYLNIGLNNISKIEGLEGCESLRYINLSLSLSFVSPFINNKLRKLDLILNFIDIEDIKESIDNLSNCKGFKNSISFYKFRFKRIVHNRKPMRRLVRLQGLCYCKNPFTHAIEWN